MKRLLAFLIVSAAVFTACTSVQDSPASDTTSSVISENSAPATTPQPNYVAEHIYNYTVRQLLNASKRENLNNSLITATIVRSEKTDGDKADIKVNFNKNREHSLDVRADCDVFYMANGFYSEYVYVTGFNADVQADKLIVTLYDRIIVYSARDFTPLLTIQPSGEKRKLIDTAVYKDGWISAFVSEDEQGFEVYDKNGKFVRDYVFEQPLFTLSSPANYNTDSVIYPRPHITFMDARQENIFYIARDSINGLVSKEHDKPPHLLFNIADESVNNFNLVKYGNLWPYNNSQAYFMISVDNSDAFRIFTIKDGKPYKDIEIKKSQLPEGFASGTIQTRSNDYIVDSISLYCDMTGAMVTVDINSGKAYTLPADTVEKYKLLYINDISSDGKYSIYSSPSHGGGDISYSNYYLVENATGKLKYIDELGGMYGGKEDTGFLQNNDVYVYTYDDFVIFNTNMDNPSPIWRLTDHFPMGENAADGVTYRYLMAARRDPVSKSVLIIYFDDNYDDDHYEDRFIDYQNNGWELKATYKAALINPGGTIGYIHDTGVNVLANWGLRPVSMYLESPTSLRIYSWANSHRYTYFEGRLDLTTGHYQSIKDFDISEYQ